MTQFETIILIISLMSTIFSLILFFIVSKKLSKLKKDRNGLETFNTELQRQLSITRREINERISTSSTSLGSTLSASQEFLQNTVNDRLTQLDKRFVSFSNQSELKLESIRSTVEKRLESIQDQNNKRLEEMRLTVDEKLQKTLDDRLSQSFTQVSERLEQVYKGLGEMHTLATGVGDLKKVLSNVKTRGILGEIQLGAILEQILSPDQYVTNFPTKKGSSAVVEFAVRLPGDGNQPVYLPIDSKFPADRYQKLIDAYDTADSATIQTAAKELERALKSSAKDIHDKYIDPPYTTDFGIMFLPFEGLYAEAVRLGMIEILAHEYKINLAGPTTMAALLNSLQMGFKTLAIQKRSSEVWEILGAVKTEFSKFSTILETTRTKLRRANDDLDSLIGTRTRAIQRKLKQVTELSSENSSEILEITENNGSEN